MNKYVYREVLNGKPKNQIQVFYHLYIRFYCFLR